MIVIISPAKAMRLDEPARAAARAAPRFAALADVLASQLAKASTAGLARMMDLSPALAALNAGRYGGWAAQPAVAAAHAMDGPAFKALSARTLSDPASADERVRILSGLYGLLRPSDTIKPYRLEMGSSLRVPGVPAGLAGGAASLYEYWGPTIAAALEDDLADAEKAAGAAPGTGVLVNAASQEYWKAVGGHLRPGTRVVTAVFPGPAVHAKAARGALARFVAEGGLSVVGQLKGFEGGAGEWRFDEGSSSGDRLVFVRGAPKKRRGAASEAPAPAKAKARAGAATAAAAAAPPAKAAPAAKRTRRK